MKVVFLVVCLALPSAVAADDVIRKEGFMSGYLQRCQQALPEKGYSLEEAETECRCQLEVVDENYEALAFLQEMGMKNQMGVALTAEEQNRMTTDVALFKGKLAKCKVRK